VKTICIQESNVRICQPFGAKVMFCRSGDVTTIDVLVDAKRKCTQYNHYICDLHSTYIVGNLKTICIQESNVRICQPFGAKVKVCQS
jgi:hypothetical protein